MCRIVSLLLLFLSACIIASCGPRYVDYFTHHDDGMVKPRVIFIPVIVSCSAPDQTSQQLTAHIRYKTMDSGELYLFSNEEVRNFLVKSGPVNFNRNDYVFNGSADFIAVLEIINHSGGEIKGRLKVIDVRGECPRIVLHQFIKQETVKRGSDLGCFKEAHQYFVDKVVERLECVIWSNR